MSHIARFATLGTVVLLLPGAAVAQPTAAGAPPAGSTVIDFNALPAGAPITTQFAALGVTISGGACAIGVGSGFTSVNVANATPAGRQCPGSPFAPDETGRYPALTFTFATPIQYFGLNASVNFNRMGDPFDLRENTLLFTTTNGFLGRLTTTFYQSPAPGFVAIQDATRFTTVTVSTGGNGYFQFDNLTFSPPIVSAVPEPSTWALMGTGLLVLGGVAVRRKRGAA
jgi:hypothetical protein